MTQNKSAAPKPASNELRRATDNFVKACVEDKGGQEMSDAELTFTEELSKHVSARVSQLLKVDEAVKSYIYEIRHDIKEKKKRPDVEQVEDQAEKRAQGIIQSLRAKVNRG